MRVHSNGSVVALFSEHGAGMRSIVPSDNGRDLVIFVCALQDSWTPPNSWPTRSFEPLVEVQATPPQADPLIYDQVTPSSSPSPLPPPPSPVVTATRESGTDEKAIILYKGVNPPLFPGGPPTGSLEPLLIVDTSGALATYKGTGNNGSTVDVGHASSAFNNSSSDANIWTGLFEGSPLYFLVCREGDLRIRGAEFLSGLSLCDRGDSDLSDLNSCLANGCNFDVLVGNVITVGF